MRETSATSEIVKSLFLHGLKITPAWESASNEAIIEALKNLGITILPGSLSERLTEGTLKEVVLKDINLNAVFKTTIKINIFRSWPGHSSNSVLCSTALNALQPSECFNAFLFFAARFFAAFIQLRTCNKRHSGYKIKMEINWDVENVPTSRGLNLL